MTIVENSVTGAPVPGDAPALGSSAVVIPAYKPGELLVPLVQALSQTSVAAIVVVDDGSGPEFQARFADVARSPKVSLIGHAVNLGKGAALKTGLNFVLRDLPGVTTIVTADADGQHLPQDICQTAAASVAHPTELVLGARQFGPDVPLRSRFGNNLTRHLFGLLVGQRLSDTQTGLRGIPAALAAKLLRVAATGYEFELDMLVLAKQLGIRMREVPISTVYLDGNASSHFNPILDSMRIYFVLLRFGVLSLLTALVDNAVFLAVFLATGGIIGAQVAGRIVALIVNYAGSRQAVFFSKERHLRLLPRYLLLVSASGVVSYGLIRLLHESLGIAIFQAKLLAETMLFIANFTLLRDFVFTGTDTDRTSARRATDWNSYYQSVPATAKLTRKYTTKVLLTALRVAGLSKADGGRTIVEIGGANSCFLDRIVSEVRPSAYHVVDNNRLGLDLLQTRPNLGRDLFVHEQDVLNLAVPVEADVVFSVGLIEHFLEADTKRAVRAHFSMLKPGGYAIISFPTPTWLYRVSRAACEAVGLWKFHDERPLDRTEVVTAVGELGQVTFEKTLWPLVFTQHLMVFRKSAGSPASA